jgi:hypothetical protein
MRRRERPGKKQLYASASVHVVAIVLVWVAQMPRTNPVDFTAIQITLVSPPSTQEAPEPEPVVEEEITVETPEPIPEEEPPPVVEEDERVEQRPEPTPTPPPPSPEPVEEAGDPEPSDEMTGEEIAVRMEGLTTDHPEYWGNIVRQIRRCFEYRGGGRLETEVLFYISRDGTVEGSSIEFYMRSGNVNFDYAAMGAVECAGTGRFGPLPEELGLDRLPILFSFRPIGGGGAPQPGPGHPIGG